MKWTQEESSQPIDEKTDRLIIPVDIRDQMEANMHIPYFEIIYDDINGVRRTYYESCNEAPISKLDKQKWEELLKIGSAIITSTVRWE